MRSSLLGALLLVSSSCGPIKESDRDLNHQNRGAGAFIRGIASEPAVKAAGADVEANSATLEKNVFGPPAKPMPYSPENSGRSREKSDEEHTTPWWQIALGGLVSFLTGNLFTRLFATVAPRLVGGPAAGAILAVVEGIARARERTRATADGKITEADLLEALGAAQSDPRLHEFIRGLAHKAEAKLAARL
jgi:hypothetical protein